VAREETFSRQKQLKVIPEDAKLTPRPKELPAWDELTDLQKTVASRLMEAYAAALAHADAQVGRVLDTLRDMGEFENTLVIFIQGDNGGSAEGGFNGQLFSQSMLNGFGEDPTTSCHARRKSAVPDLYNQYPGAWGWAMNTPFQYYKMVSSHFGGTRNGMVMSWPARIKDNGGVRSQFHFVSDIMATLLDAAGVEAPASINGVAQDPSMAPACCTHWTTVPRLPRAPGRSSRCWRVSASIRTAGSRPPNRHRAMDEFVDADCRRPLQQTLGAV
jgi:arylsulfatase